MAINTKTTYLLPTILFLLLLVDPSVAPPVLPFLENIEQLLGRRPFNLERLRRQNQKKMAKEIIKERIKKLLNQTIDEERSSPHQPPNGQPEKIPGLHLVKQYLNDYGYMKYNGSYDDYLYQDAVSAIKTYQHFNNLTVTGYPDNDTINQLTLLRCAVPDLNLTYHLSQTDKLSWPLGTTWFPNRTNLTYGFLHHTQIPPNATKAFRNSFNRWSAAILTLEFTETSYEAADIKIGFYNFDNRTFGAEVMGATVIKLGYAGKNVTFGGMLLDASKYWLLPDDNVTELSWEDGVVDLESEAMHQIGHLVGLQHSSHVESVMYPYVLPSLQRKVDLSNYDLQQIKQVYYSSGCGGSSLGFLITFSLGFASMLLFYSNGVV